MSETTDLFRTSFVIVLVAALFAVMATTFGVPFLTAFLFMLFVVIFIALMGRSLSSS